VPAAGGIPVAGDSPVAGDIPVAGGIPVAGVKAGPAGSVGTEIAGVPAGGGGGGGVWLNEVSASVREKAEAISSFFIF